MPGQVGTALVIQIHRQEGDVTGHVHITEPIVEFNAVVNVQRPRCQMDMLQVQITVAIANPALLNASSEQRGVSPVEFICVKANCLEPSARKGVPEERRRLPKIFVSADSQPINPTPLFDFLS